MDEFPLCHVHRNRGFLHLLDFVVGQNVPAERFLIRVDISFLVLFIIINFVERDSLVIILINRRHALRRRRGLYLEEQTQSAFFLLFTTCLIIPTTKTEHSAHNRLYYILHLYD